MRLLIIGVTAQAAWLTGRCHQAGLDVKWWPRSATSALPRNHTSSLTIHQYGSIQTLDAIPSIENIHAALDPLPDWIIFTMPGWALGDVAFELIQHIPPAKFPSFLSLVDGIGPTEKLANYFGAEHVVRGVMTARFTWHDDAHTQIHVEGGVDMVISRHALNDVLGAWLNPKTIGGGITIADDTALKWSNVLRLLPGNALAAIMDRSPHEVYADARLRAIEVQQLKEAVRVMDALKIKPIALPGVNVPRLVRWVRYVPGFLWPRVLKGYWAPPTLRAELQAGVGRSDAAYLNGAVALAAQASLPFATPVNHALAVSVTDLAEGRAQWSQFRNNPEYLETIIRIMVRH